MLTSLVVLALTLSPIQSYNRGNQLYAQKDFAGAAEAYQAALQAGPHPAVQYNLGNALFKLGRIGRAILFYRRAHYLAPRDADIASNLNFARSFRVDKMPGSFSPWERVLDAGFHRLSHREALLLADLGLAIAALLMAAWVVRRWTACLIAAAAIALVALFGLGTAQVWKGEIDEHPAVIVVPEVHALSGPSEDSKEILLLHDGSEVRIRELRGGYLLVQMPGGGGGWIPKDSVERVY